MDPEEDLVQWMRTGAPVGWRGQIRPNGVFPEVDKDTAAVEKSKAFSNSVNKESLWDSAKKDNYKSFCDAGEEASKEVVRIRDAGFAEEFETWWDMEAEIGDHAQQVRVRAEDQDVRRDQSKAGDRPNEEWRQWEMPHQREGRPPESAGLGLQRPQAVEMVARNCLRGTGGLRFLGRLPHSVPQE